jgi:hypothetical protein
MTCRPSSCTACLVQQRCGCMRRFALRAAATLIPCPVLHVSWIGHRITMMHACALGEVDSLRV